MKLVGLAHREWHCGSVQNRAADSTFRYLLATCSFTPLYGRLCDVLGRKRANQTALIFAGLGVLMCGLSTNMETLILARFVRLYLCKCKLAQFFLAFRHWWRRLNHYGIVSLLYPLLSTGTHDPPQYHS